MDIGELRPLLTALALPPASLLLLAALGWLWSLRRPLWGGALMTLAGITLWLLSCNAVAIWLSQELLARVTPLPVHGIAATLKQQQVQAVLVLGGGVHAQSPEYGEPQPTSYTAARLQYGVWLAKQSGLPLAFAGGVAWANAGQNNPTEADSARRLLQQWQGPPLRWVDDSSHDTFDSARVMRLILQRAGIQRIALVTSAWHMPRSILAFEKVGFTVLPAPMGYVVPLQRPLLEWLPSAHGLQASSNVLREWLGLLVSRLS